MTNISQKCGAVWIFNFSPPSCFSSDFKSRFIFSANQALASKNPLSFESKLHKALVKNFKGQLPYLAITKTALSFLLHNSAVIRLTDKQEKDSNFLMLKIESLNESLTDQMKKLGQDTDWDTDKNFGLYEN